MGRFWWAGATGFALIVLLPTGLRFSGSADDVGRLGPEGRCAHAGASHGLGSEPAAGRIKVRSASLDDRRSHPIRSVPVRIRIPAIDVRASVRAVGVTRDGSVEVPRVGEVGWYRFGGAFGRCGSSVLIAHVSWGERRGAFFRLRELVPGDLVSVRLQGRVDRIYRVKARRVYRKSALPSRIFRRTGRPTLTLMTCGGPFSEVTGRYLDNVVVFATPQSEAI